MLGGGDFNKPDVAGSDRHGGLPFDMSALLPMVVEPPPKLPDTPPKSSSGRMPRSAKLRALKVNAPGSRPTSALTAHRNSRPQTSACVHRCAKRDCLCGLPAPCDLPPEESRRRSQLKVRMMSQLVLRRSLGSHHASMFFFDIKSQSENKGKMSMLKPLEDNSHSELAFGKAFTNPNRRPRGTGYLNRGLSINPVKPKLAMMRLRNALGEQAKDHLIDEIPSDSSSPSAGVSGKSPHRMSVQHETQVIPKLSEDSDMDGRHHLQAHFLRSSSNSLLEADDREETRQRNAESPGPNQPVLSPAHSARSSAAEVTQVPRKRCTIHEGDSEESETEAFGDEEKSGSEHHEEDRDDNDFSFARDWHKRRTMTEGKHSHVSKIPLQERLHRVEMLRQVKLQRVRRERQQEMMRKKFESLPPEEAETIRRAFEQFDRNHNGYLDRDEAIACLKELGIWGITPQERHEVLDLCSEASSWMKVEEPVVKTTSTTSRAESCPSPQVDGDHHFNLTLQDFALHVVPRVRQKLMDMRSTNMLKEFFKFDEEDNGKLSKQKTAEVARCMGIDKRIINHIEMTELLRQGQEGDPDASVVDFEKFQMLIAAGREQLDRMVRMRERTVQMQHGINEELFNDMREDLVAMHQLFLCYDQDDSGSLSFTEITYMFKELGLMPKSFKGREEVSVLLRNHDVDGNGEFNFSEFLELVREIRVFWCGKKREEHLHFFEKYDREKRGMLSVHDISAILADLGFVPKTRREQEEVAHSINDVDEDEAGFISFAKFQHMAQRVNEKLKILRYEEELDCAIRLGFSEKQMRDLKFVFDSLDTEGTGQLDLNEVRNAITMLRKHPCQEALEGAFKELDTDRSGEICFKEYLFLMQAMRDGEGIFADDSQQRVVMKVKNLDCRILRRCLDFFKLSREYLNSLSREELVPVFCDYMGVQESSNLEEVLGAKNIGDLYKLAERKGEADELLTFSHMRTV